MKENMEIETVKGSETTCSVDKGIKFDPSDYLPRRTSRASAHAASKLIQKSLKNEKTDPCKLAYSQDVSMQKGQASSTLKTKSKKRKSSLKPQNDCSVKLVRCDEDHQSKSTSVEHLNKRKSPGKLGKSTDVSDVYKDGDSDSDCVYIEKESSPTWTDQKIAEGLNSESQFNGESQLDMVSTGSRSCEQAAAHNTRCEDLPDVMWVVSDNSFSAKKAVGHARYKSDVLERALQDLDAVVTMVPGGRFELRCKFCPQTYFLAADLIRHKSEAHNCSRYMCEDCSEVILSLSDVGKHRCRAKYRCDTCGVLCKQPHHLSQHKAMVHKKSMVLEKTIEYVCSDCLFEGTSQEELDSHQCRGTCTKTSMLQKPDPVKRTPIYEPAFPVNNRARNDSHSDVVNGRSTNTSKSNLVSSSTEMKYLCEVCLNMYPSSTALEVHRCEQPPENVEPSVSSFPTMDSIPNPSVTSMTMAASVNSIETEAFREAEQLAKFYSSLVYKT